MIWATPVIPGVHCVGAVSEFQTPAQAAPLLATVTIAGLLDWYEKVSVSVVPVPLSAVAVKACVFPSSRETFGPGVKETIAGMGLGTTLVELLLLHPPSKAQLRKVKTTQTPEMVLPMKALMQ